MEGDSGRQRRGKRDVREGRERVWEKEKAGREVVGVERQ